MQIDRTLQAQKRTVLLGVHEVQHRNKETLTDTPTALIENATKRNQLAALSQQDENAFETTIL